MDAGSTPNLDTPAPFFRAHGTWLLLEAYFRVIPLGDIDLRKETRLEESVVVDCTREGRSVRRMYRARIEDRKFPMTIDVPGEQCGGGLAGIYLETLMPSGEQRRREDRRLPGISQPRKHFECQRNQRGLFQKMGPSHAAIVKVAMLALQMPDKICTVQNSLVSIGTYLQSSEHRGTPENDASGERGADNHEEPDRKLLIQRRVRINPANKTM
ncbi:hypothetical protein K438DRAFT_1780041 [Mycena galopus ATCC 62051]|nr:hypothetical protein K438DRAFT_1780041 [Mycena galopus ATCC 62051]